MDDTIRNEVRFRPGEGYLFFTGWLYILAGSLTLLGSILALAQARWNDLSPWFGLEAGARPDWFLVLLGHYLSLMAAWGWLFGALLIATGVLCLKRRARRVIQGLSVLNLFIFPHGTTVSIMALHGLGRNRVSGAFADEESSR